MRDLVTAKLDKGISGVTELINLILEFQKRLITFKPLEFSISNIIKRVISVIRDEAKRLDLEIAGEKIEEEKKESMNMN